MRIKTGTLVLLLVATAAPSWADQEDRDIAIANLLSPLGNAVRWTRPTPGYNGGGDEIKQVRERCREAIAEARKAGVRPRDEVRAWDAFAGNPKARVQGKEVIFKFEDAGWYCDDLDKRTAHWDLVLRMDDGKKLAERIPAGLTDTEKKDIAPELVADTYDLARRCKSGLEAERAAGAASIDADGTAVTLADAGAACDAIQAWGDLQKAAYAQKLATLGAKYAAVGIKGDRLDLFVYYDDLEGWYLPGCKSSTMQPKKLKAARALFQWLTDGEGTITIRKFSFKGDKYTITERQFYTEAAAYRGCR
ncbi:MAG TPA: hypothetical protein VL172_05455 [Kofleriaceae bacterium]|nr:hypothetical protein [Kofleriaceae bacterium]